MKKITLILLLLFSVTAFSQDYKITVSPKSLNATSLIQISVKKKGEYQLKIIDPNNKEILLKGFNIVNDTKMSGYKFNFNRSIKGDYTFILLNRRGKIVKELKINKTTK